jgi:predicted AlkP superfamily phosphohydrolase/phosphomutase
MAPTLLIGLDGATFTVLDPYVERGVMPCVGELLERGTRASLRSVMPPLTPPAWTSLMTGKHPGQHGVFDFFQKDEPDSIYFRFATSQDVRSATIWTLASEAGRRIVSLNFPLMFPPPPVDGCVVPGGMMPWRQLRLGCYPPGLFDRLKAVPGFSPREMLDMELEVKAIEGCPEDELADWVERHIVRERRWYEVLRHLMREQPADLVGVLFDGVDKLQHLCWRFIDPACRPPDPTPWERQMIEACERYFRSLDGMLGELVTAAGPDATVVIASDHGFGATRDVFHVNSWLERQAYLTWADGEDGDGAADATAVGFAEMTRHVHELDWDRTVAYAATPTSQGVNIVAGDRRDELRAELADALRRVRNPATGRPLVLDVLTREEAFPGPYRDLAPDLFLVLDDGAAVSIVRSDSVWRRRPHPSGNHQWQGVLLACGPDIPAGAELDELSIVDVAPLILYSLGVPIPDDLDGRLPAALFARERLQRRPPTTAPPGREPDGPAADVTYDPEEEATIVGRLRALGYVE